MIASMSAMAYNLDTRIFRNSHVDFWPGYEMKRLGDVTPGSTIFFMYQDVNYYALVVDPLRKDGSPDLIVFYPKHPVFEHAGILNGSVIGGLGNFVKVISNARAVVAEPHADLENGSGYVAAGSLIVMNNELALVCYVDNHSKGAYSLQNGAHLGQARANEYYKAWWLEVRDGQIYRKLVKVTARPRN